MSGQHIDVRMDRRTAIKWLLVAFGGLHGAPGALAGASVSTGAGGASAAGTDSAPSIPGYGKDPDLLRSYLPGELWPLTFTGHQRASARWLVDQILPAAGSAPAAGTLGVHDFIDEWVSAPYEPCRADRALILEGLDWIHTEVRGAGGRGIGDLRQEAREAMLETLAHPGPGIAGGVPEAFFGRFRKLVAIGYFTTPAGMQDLGYVGNRPLDRFEGPPEAALRMAGVKV